MLPGENFVANKFCIWDKFRFGKIWWVFLKRSGEISWEFLMTKFVHQNLSWAKPPPRYRTEPDVGNEAKVTECGWELLRLLCLDFVEVWL